MSRPKDEPPLAPGVVIASHILGLGLGLLIAGVSEAVIALAFGIPLLLGMIGIALFRLGRGDYS